jgi:hypothetical protein
LSHSSSPLSWILNGSFIHLCFVALYTVNFENFGYTMLFTYFKWWHIFIIHYEDFALILLLNSLEKFVHVHSSRFKFSKILLSAGKLKFYLFLAVPGFEHKASHLLGRHSPTQATPEPFFVLGIFQLRSCKLFALAGLEPPSSWSLPPE